MQSAGTAAANEKTDTATTLFDRYIRLVETIYSSGGIFLEEINRRWARSQYNDKHEDKIPPVHVPTPQGGHQIDVRHRHPLRPPKRQPLLHRQRRTLLLTYRSFNNHTAFRREAEAVCRILEK